VPDSSPLAEHLILDTIRLEAARRELPRVLLIGMQAAASVTAANGIVGAERVALLHLDRATGAAALSLGNPERYLGEDLSPLGPFAVVGLNVEAAKSYRLLREIVGLAAGSMDEAGVVLVAGPRRGGAEVAARALRELLESVELLSYRKGERIYRAARPRPRTADEPVAGSPDVARIEVRGRWLRLVQDERIFARGRLDPATRMLAEAFEVRPGASVLDLGSGSGVLGILAAILEPSSRVSLVDSDPLAVEVGRRNVELNGAANVTAYLSDVLTELPDERFDLVLMNPPFHRGRVHDTSIAERFVAEAGAALRRGGSMYVVCNRFLRYEPVLERLVGPVREAAGDRQFKVLLATRR
jgi:16S rRNA (guanine1207-N2)-methyltransferase